MCSYEELQQMQRVQYGAVVAIWMDPTTATKSAVPHISAIAVVAQGRAPAKGALGARPIYGIFCHWCL